MVDKVSLKKQLGILIPFGIFYILLTWWVSGNSFFWDTIQLGSEHAHWYYENNFAHFWLPNHFDSGHFPVFGMYLAACWKIFGKSLIVSHWAMLPFLLGIVWQAYILVSHFFKGRNVYLVLIIFLTDTALLTQSVLISPDVVLVFFMLLASNAIFSRKRLLQIIAMIGLATVSMRGMMIVGALFVINLLYENNAFSAKKIVVSGLRNSVFYIPAAIATALFLGGHYLEKGWIGYHQDSPWAGSFETVDFVGFLRNIVILGFRLVDLGRLFLWIAFGVFIIIFIKNKKINILFKRTEKGLPPLLLMTLIIVVFTTPVMLIHKHLIAHRYLLPVSLFFSLTVCNLVFNYLQNIKIKNALFALLLAGMISGNLWVYPEHIAKGWDSTLAHLPYYSLRNDMIAYIESKDIDFQDVGTCFPNRAMQKYTELNNDTRTFAELDFTTNKYILYSNIFNDFTDEQLLELKKLKVIKQIAKGQVYMVLYLQNSL